MSDRQLSILVKARDEASGVFKEVGGSSTELKGKLDSINGSGLDKLKGSLGGLEEAGHSLKMLARGAEHVFIAFEALKIGSSLVSATFATMSGDADQAAEGQKAFLDTVKEFPIVGGLASGALEALGNKLGILSIKFAEARQAAEDDFLKALDEIDKKLKEGNNENRFIGLSPTQSQIETAKQNYQKAIDAIKPMEKKLLAAGRYVEDDEKSNAVTQIAIDKQRKIADDPDADPKEREEAQKKIEELQLRTREGWKAQADKIAEIRKNAQTKLDNDLKQIREQSWIKEAQDTADRQNKIADETRQLNRKLVSLTDDLHVKQLEADHRGYEARQAQLQNSLKAQLDAIKENASKMMAEIAKENTELEILASNGDKKAKEKLDENYKRMAEIHANEQSQTSAAMQSSNAEQNLAAQQQIHSTMLKALQEEANAEDAIAAEKLKRLQESQKQEEQEKALLAVINDQTKSEKDRNDAQAAYDELKKSQTEKLDAELRHSEFASLEKFASLGDLNAGIQAKQLQLTKEREAEEAKLNAILEDRNSTDAQRAEAQKQLSEVAKLGEAQTNKSLEDSALFTLQQEAGLGDKIAEQQLKKIQLEKTFYAEKQKVLAILKDEKATEEQKAQAKKELDALDSTEKAAEKRLHPKEQEAQLADLQASQYLTGVSASAGQEKADPIVLAQQETTKVTQNMSQILSDLASWFKGNSQVRKELR